MDSRKLLINVGWDGLERSLRVVNVVVGLLFIRYIGPERFGEFSYLAAVVALLFIFTNPGMDSILVRDLSRSGSGESRELFAAGWGLKLAFAAAVWALSVLAVALTRPGLSGLACLMGLTVVTCLGAYLQSGFRAALEIRGVSLALSVNTLLFAGLQVAAMAKGLSLVIFVALAALKELAAVLLVGGLVARHGGLPLRPRLDPARSAYLLRQTWPLFLSGAFCTAYVRVDQVLLMNMASAASLGVYAAAVKLTEYWGVLPSLLLASFLPAVSRHQPGSSGFEKASRVAFRLMTQFAVPLCTVTTLYSREIAGLLLGSHYSGSAAVLSLLVWSNLFVFWGSLNNTLLIASGAQRLDLVFTSVTLALNLALNLLLIPRYQELGAAVSTVVSYAAGPALGFAFQATRRWSAQMFGSLPFPVASACAAAALARLTPGPWPVGAAVFCAAVAAAYAAHSAWLKTEEWRFVTGLLAKAESAS